MKTLGDRALKWSTLSYPLSFNTQFFNRYNRVFDINEMYFFDTNSFEWIKMLVGPDKRLKGNYPIFLHSEVD